MLNRADLIDRIALDAGITKGAAGLAVTTFTAVVADAVRKGERVSLTGFGAFERAHRPARKARNPATGAAVNVAERFVPRFKPSKSFKDAMPAVKGGSQGKK